MTTRTKKKQSSSWTNIFHKAVIHYSAKKHNCQRWRNRHKAQKLADHWWHEYKRRFK